MAYLLIVDDDKDLVEEIAEVLRGEGHEVAFELDTKRALDSIEERRPDLLILDVMFPESDSAGFAFARELADKFAESGKLRILMLTAVNQHYLPGFSADDIDDVWLPITDFMEKPVDFNALRSKVTDLLGRK